MRMRAVQSAYGTPCGLAASRFARASLIVDAKQLFETQVIDVWCAICVVQ